RLRERRGRRHLQPVPRPADVRAGGAGQDVRGGRGQGGRLDLQGHLREVARPGAPVANRADFRTAKASLAGASAVAAAALLLLLAAGCGGGGETSQPATTQIRINTGNPPP